MQTNIQLIDYLNILVTSLEIAQKKGAFTLMQASEIVNTITAINELLIAETKELEPISE